MGSDFEQRPDPWPLGPFQREPAGVYPPVSERLTEALAGVELGAYDCRVLDWLTTWEPSTLAVIAGWVKRARRDAHIGAVCPGCDRRGRDIRQEVNGDLVCHRCGRMVALTPPEDPDVR